MHLDHSRFGRSPVAEIGLHLCSFHHAGHCHRNRPYSCPDTVGFDPGRNDCFANPGRRLAVFPSCCDFLAGILPNGLPPNRNHDGAIRRCQRFFLVHGRHCRNVRVDNFDWPSRYSSIVCCPRRNTVFPLVRSTFAVLMTVSLKLFKAPLLPILS